MKISEIIVESSRQKPEELLAYELPKLKKHDYDTIDRLMKRISAKYNMSPDHLHNRFVSKYGKIPDDWVKELDNEALKEVDMVLDKDEERDLNQHPLMQACIKAACNQLKLKTVPKIEFSYDTDVARKGHHTGRFTPDENGGTIWIYCRNRNLVDIIRTVAHELCHCKQREDDRITPDSAKPGSPIEREADVFAGIFVKLFGRKHREIFENRNF